jgi:hypothetical protein
MKNINKFPIYFLLIFTLALLTSCVPIPTANSGLVVGNTYRLESGKTLNHDLTVVGGKAIIEDDATVNGDLAVIGGDVTVNGNINGDVSVLGGYVSIQDDARISGAISSMGGTINQSNKAIVEGKDNSDRSRPNTTPNFQNPAMQVSLDPITRPLMAIFQALALAALAIVVNLFIPKPMERTSSTALEAPVASGGIGCLTILVLVIMAITIILLPVSLLGVLVMAFAVVFGWLALGLLVGRKIAGWLNQPWSDPIHAGVGTFVLSLLTSMINIIPCIGWLAPVLVSMVALGAVVLSRFGTQNYPPGFTTPHIPRPTAPYSAPSPQPGARVYPPESSPETPPQE